MSEKVEAAGGDMGNPFDDGIFDGVKRIIVGKSLLSVSYIKIEYDKDGDTESREHGQFTRRHKEVINFDYVYSSICSCYHTFIALYICCF